MKIGYPVKFIYKDEEFISLYFDDDKLLTQDDKILCYNSKKELYETQTGNFIIDESLSIYDFDVKNITNPVDYKDVLNKWNILNTIAKMFNMYFEGDSNKRNYTYNYLFHSSFLKENLPKLYKIPDRCIKDLKKVFYKKDRYLKKLKKIF